MPGKRDRERVEGTDLRLRIRCRRFERSPNAQPARVEIVLKARTDADETAHFRLHRTFGEPQRAGQTLLVFRRLQILAGLRVPGGMDHRVGPAAGPRPPGGALRENITTGDDRFDRIVVREALLFAFPHNRTHLAAALAQRAQHLPADKPGRARE